MTKLECQVIDNEVRTLERNLALKKTELGTCDWAARSAQLSEESYTANQAYIAEKRQELNKTEASYNTYKTILKKTVDAISPLQDYADKLNVENSQLESKKTEEQQYERKHRREFLDNMPQSGVSGPAGVRTSDDKVILTFWITYGVAVAAVAAIVMNMYEAQIGGTANKFKLGAIILAVAYGIAYYFITVYG